MPLDFRKLGGANTADTLLHPREIFAALPGKSPEYKYLRDVQAEVVDQWFPRRNEKDLVLTMNTGSGKTLVGLLMLKSCLNEHKGPALYVAPDNFLVKQVIDKANLIGLTVTDSPTDYAFRRGQAIGVVSIYKLVNGKSVFGVAEEGRKINIGSIIIDDAHACLGTTEGQFTLVLRKDENAAYNDLFKLFRDELERQSGTGLLDIECSDTRRNMLVPYWAWINKQRDVARVLHQVKDDEKAMFVWPLIENHLNLCRCVFSGEEVEISPKCLPIDAIPSFTNAERRMFMTATLPSDDILVTDFNVNVESIKKRITPKYANDIGDRMILTPQELNPKITGNEIKSFLKALSTQYNIVVIVPSAIRAKYWSDVSKDILTSSNLQEGVDRLCKGHIGLVVLVNKYDGVDLPDDACRVLVIDGLPDVRRRIDEIEQYSLEGSDELLGRKIQKIEQGMGRAIRSSSDYCVVFLMGPALVNCLCEKNAKSKFSAATRVQLELSYEVGEQVLGKPLKDYQEIIDYCLKKDPTWLKVSKGMLVNLKYEEQGRVSSIALARRRAFHAAGTKQFDQAVVSMQNAVNETDEPKMKGWLKQELAEYEHYQNPADSQEILKSALSFNDHLLKPISGITYSKLTAKSFNQAQQCAEFLSKFKDDKNMILVSLNAILENLQFDVIQPHYFERAMNDIAQYIGLNGQQPELETSTGADVLWEISHNNYFIIACKNCAESPTISKRYCDELSGSVNWFNRQYEDCKYVPVIVHPSHVVDHLASPSPEMRVIDEERLPQLKNAVQYLTTSIVSSNYFDKIEAINDLLLKYNLTAEKFIQVYTNKFEVEKKR